MPCSITVREQIRLPPKVFGPLDFRPFCRLASALGTAPEYTENQRTNNGPKTIRADLPRRDLETYSCWSVSIRRSSTLLRTVQRLPRGLRVASLKVGLLLKSEYVLPVVLHTEGGSVGSGNKHPTTLICVLDFEPTLICVLDFEPSPGLPQS